MRPACAPYLILADAGDKLRVAGQGTQLRNRIVQNADYAVRAVSSGRFAAPGAGSGRAGSGKAGESDVRLTRRDGTPLRVLVVEDDLNVRHDLEDFLAGCGAAIITGTPWGTGAVLLARQQRPDAVVLDIQLFGEMDGVEAGREILTRLGIPVVFMSVRDDDETRGRIAGLGGPPELIHKLQVRDLLVPAIRRACGLDG